MEKTIICIGREYGSGGHAIGKILAKRTGYEFYDKERFIAIAKERGFEGEVEEYLEEQPMNSLLYSIAMNYSRPKKKPFPFGRRTGCRKALHHYRTLRRLSDTRTGQCIQRIRSCGYGETYRNRYGTRSYQYSIKGQTQD